MFQHFAQLDWVISCQGQVVSIEHVSFCLQRYLIQVHMYVCQSKLHYSDRYSCFQNPIYCQNSTALGKSIKWWRQETSRRVCTQVQNLIRSWQKHDLTSYIFYQAKAGVFVCLTLAPVHLITLLMLTHACAHAGTQWCTADSRGAWHREALPREQRPQQASRHTHASPVWGGKMRPTEGWNSSWMPGWSSSLAPPMGPKAGRSAGCVFCWTCALQTHQTQRGRVKHLSSTSGANSQRKLTSCWPGWGRRGQTQSGYWQCTGKRWYVSCYF